jgi:hypothetical protein
MLERRFQQSVGRPLGVTLICVWFLMNFVGSLGLTLIVLTGADFIRLITGLLPGNSPLLSPYLFAVVLLLVAIADFAIAIGLWKLLSWGRMAALVLSVISALTMLGLAVVVFRISTAEALMLILRAILDGAVIWYLLQPSIQEVFMGAGVSDYGDATWQDSSSGGSFSAGAAAIPQTAPQPVPQPARTSQASAPSVDRTRPLYEPEPVMGWLVARGGARPGDQLKLRGGSSTIGRDGRRSQLVVDDSSVSGEHAKIRFENGVFVIYDLASTNGTYVNGRRVEKQRLMDNDMVRLGRQEFVFKAVDPKQRTP